MPDPQAQRRTPAGDDLAAVSAAIQRHTGVRPLSLDPKHTYRPRVVVEATFEARPPLVFKGESPTGDDDAIVLECWAMDRARELGVPVPSVLALDLSAEIFAGRFALFERARGVALDEAALAAEKRDRLLREAGRFIRPLHEIAIAGYGRLDDRRFLETGQVRGNRATWPDYALAPAIAALPVLARASVITPAEVPEFETTLYARRELFEGVHSGQLLHGDFDETHIFVDPGAGAISGIIDWGDRESGDPAWEFATYALWDGLPDVRSVLAGYAPDAAERAAIEQRLPAYMLAEALRIAAKYVALGRLDSARETIDGAWPAVRG